MSLSAKLESLAQIHGRYQRAGRVYKTRILDEFCATCGYHRKSALRLLRRPLRPPGARGRPGPKPVYEPDVLLPVLKEIWCRLQRNNLSVRISRYSFRQFEIQ